MTFAQKINRLMEINGESQRSLAASLNVSHRTVGGWLTGTIPHRSMLLKIASHYGIFVDVFLDDALDLPQDRAIEALRKQYSGTVEMAPAKIEVRKKSVRARVEERGPDPRTLEALATVIDALPAEQRKKVLDSLVSAMVESLNVYATARSAFGDSLLAAVRSVTPTQEHLQKIKEASESINDSYQRALLAQRAFADHGLNLGGKIQTAQEVYSDLMGAPEIPKKPPS